MNFQDRASSGISRMTGLVENLNSATRKASGEVSQSFLQMQDAVRGFNTDMVQGSVLTQLGSQIQGVGSGILSTVTKIGANAFGVGKQFENWRMSLTAMYGSLEEANKMIDWGLEMAVKTPFEIEDVIDGILRMKASGIEANKELTAMTATGQELTQNMLMFASDLASLRPEQGMAGAIRAMQELLGDHDKRSIQTRFGIIMDWDFSDQDKLEQQFADKVAQMAGGLTNQLADTVDIKVSNLNDLVYSMYKSMADAGWFDAVKSSFDYFYEKINTLDLAGVGKSLSESLMSLWKPIDSVIKKATDLGVALINLVASNPQIAKLGMILTAVAGSVVLLSGTMLALKGLFIMTKAGLGVLTTSFQFFTTQLGSSIGKIASTIWSMKGMIATVGLLYAVWQSDFGGIRTMLTNFMNNVYQAFTYASKTSKLGATEMIDAVDKLNMNNVGDRLKYRLLQLSVLWKAVCESWNSYSLSEETFRKVEELGLLPLLSTILDVKYGFERFVEGFIAGWQKASDFIAPAVKWLGDKFWALMDFLFPVKDGLDELGLSADELARKIKFEQIEKLGEALGFVAGVVAPVWLGFKALSIIFSPFIKVAQGVWGVLSTIGGVLMGIPSLLGKVGKGILGLPLKIFTTLKDKIETVQIAFMLLKDKVMIVAGKLGGFFAPFLSSAKGFAGKILKGAGGLLGKIIGIVVGWGSKLGSVIWGIAGTIGTALGGIPAGLVLVVAGILIAIGTLIYTHWEEICNWWNESWEGIKENWNKFSEWCGEWFGKIVTKLKDDWQGVLNFFSSVGEGFKEGWSNVCSWWSDKTEEWCNFWTEKWVNIQTGFGEMKENFKNWWSDVCTFWQDKLSSWGTFWSDKIDGMKNKFSEMKDNLQSWWSDTCQYWVDKASGWKEGFSNIVDNVKTGFSNATENLKTWWSGVCTYWKEKLSSWGTYWSEKLEGMKTKFSGMKDKLKTWWSDTCQYWKDKASGWKTSFGATVDSVKTRFSESKDKIKSWWSDAMTNLSEKANGWKTKFTDTLSGVRTRFSESKDKIKTWWSDTMTTLQSKGDTWKTNFSTTLDNVRTNFSESKEKIKSWWSDSMTTLQTKGNTWKTNFSTTLSGVRTSFSESKDKIKSWWSDTMSNLQTKGNTWKTNFSTTLSNVRTSFSDSKTKIQNWWSGAMTDLQNKGNTWKGNFSTKVNEVKTNFSTMSSNLKTTFSGATTDFQNKFTTFVNNSKSKYEGFKSNMSSIGNSIKSTFNTITQNMANGFSNKINSMKSAFTTLKSHAQTVTNGISSFFSQLGNKIWGSMKGALNNIIRGFNSMINSLNSKLKFSVPSWVPLIGGNSFGIHIPNLPYLNTGGYIKGEGVSYLHPNEVVINDELTQKLRGFLDNNEGGSGQEIVVKNQFDPEEFKSAFNLNANARQLVSTNSSSTQNDNSVTFSEGAIQINVTGANSPDYDAEKLAEMIMEKIKRKANIKRSLNYGR